LRFVLWQFGSGKSGIFILDAQCAETFFRCRACQIKKLLGTWRVTKRLSVHKIGGRGSNKLVFKLADRGEAERLRLSWLGR
jgi:hypothetical protein